MASARLTTESRRRKREVILQIPSQVLAANNLSTGDTLAFAINDSDDGGENAIPLKLPENAGRYAPERPIRSNNGEYVINLPARVRDSHDLDPEHEFSWDEHASGPLAIYP